VQFTALSKLLTVQISLWCILGTLIHGWQILCYPLAWLGIAIFFWGLNVHYDRRHAPTGRPSDLKPGRPTRTWQHETQPEETGVTVA